ncbi:hypothetical protein OFN37_39420, partial [Escherichia coli]|nr:hypothetical protein [Escherichia coli]
SFRLFHSRFNTSLWKGTGEKSISKVVVSIGKYIICEKATLVENDVINVHFINDFCFEQKKIRSG